MPIYMDRHDVSEAVTAELIAQLHQQDLNVQDQFECRGLTYWFDDKRKTAFCLIEAPNEQAIRDMHNHAHGDVPYRVIEVDVNIVESFLGRIGDPEKAQNTDLNIINDPAFRVIMVIDLQIQTLRKEYLTQLREEVDRMASLVPEVLNGFDGCKVKQGSHRFLISFRSVSSAIDAAMDLQRRFGPAGNLQLKVGLCTGVPVTEKNLIFEEAIRLAERMATMGKGGIIVSAELRELYDSQNAVSLVGRSGVCCLTPADEQFITQLMEHAEKNWGDIDLKVDDLNKVVGYSKPQLYRKMVQLTGKSPVTFIRDYRLNTALSLLNKEAGNVSQIAYETGFSSPSYFGKCFQKRYGQSPTEYLAARNV
jgi:AraC-like DNA-binding protein